MSTKWRASVPAYPPSSPEKDLAWALEMDSLLDSVSSCASPSISSAPSTPPAGGNAREAKEKRASWAWDWLWVPLPIALPGTWPA